MKHIFQYSDIEINYLKKRDKRLGEAIDKIGMIEREVHPNLFVSLIHAIVGQQISTKAVNTIWGRMQDAIGEISPQSICDIPSERLQACGLTFKKVEYMKSVSHKVVSGEFDIDSLYQMSDEQVCSELSKLNGIGVWTAQMLMTFSMQRPNIISYGDLAILRGLRMLYRHRKITKELFAKYERRYSPYASVASIYLWAVAAGKIDGLSDPAPKPKSSAK